MDRLRAEPETRARLTDSIETALRLAQGLLNLQSADDEPEASSANPAPTPATRPMPSPRAFILVGIRFLLM